MKRFMERALELAAAYRGQTAPNPMVGAVVVKDGIIVGEGAHPRAGQPHAEVFALDAAGAAARGATLYVTLEPCNHQGKTPPCTQRIIAAGITRVVAAMQDPNPRVSGSGFATLRQAGIAVETGMMQAQAEELNEVFIHHITTGLPFVTMKAALSLDGRIALHPLGKCSPNGAHKLPLTAAQPTWISNSAARQQVHQLRQQHDAILIGKGTLLADNPRLNVRLNGTETEGPQKIVLMPTLDIPPQQLMQMNIYQHARTRPLILCCHQTVATPEQVRRYAAQNIHIIAVDGTPDELNLHALCQALAQRGITSLLLEGGSGVYTSFIRARLINKVILHQAPILLGNNGLAVIGDIGATSLTTALPLRRTRVTTLNDNICISGYPQWPGNQNEEESCSPAL
jgi:diaminohydroxyphosphoribosylaminopyrimidine deaminase/5-amino-6-(5-phosphoribosylamino)uracil reductase